MASKGYALRVGKSRYTEAWGTRHRKSTLSEEARKRRRAAYMHDYLEAYRETHREELRRNYRRCMPPLSKLVTGYEPLNAAKPAPPPPCGGDCANCPYDNGCRYPDADDRTAKYYINPQTGKPSLRETRRRCNAEYADRLRELRKHDAELDAACKERARANSDKHRAKVRWCKAHGEPMDFERTWCAVGDPERFKAMWAETGKSPQNMIAALAARKKRSDLHG